MADYIKSPFYEALDSITMSTPPDFTKEIFSSMELNDSNFDRLQEWCVNAIGIHWGTGIGVIEAVDMIVDEALSNGNIVDAR